MSMNFNQICFYSHYGTGDLFNSRSIVKYLTNKYPQFDFHYAHNHSPEYTKDLDVKHAKIQDFMQTHSWGCFGEEKDVYINTWIGQDSKYVLPGIGCVLPKYIEMFNVVLKTIGLDRLPENEYLFIPEIVYDLDLDYIFDFLFPKYFGLKKVLICNGKVQSNQSSNFDMTNDIIQMASHYPNIIFFVTEKFPCTLSNILFTSDITGKQNDLIDISFLSENCDIIVGRSSGPYVYSQTRTNLFDRSKIFISFTYNRNSSRLYTGEVNAFQVWSDNFSNFRRIVEKYL